MNPLTPPDIESTFKVEPLNPPTIKGFKDITQGIGDTLNGGGEACSVCGSPDIDGYTVTADGDGEPRCAGHFPRAPDGPLVRAAVEFDPPPELAQ